MGIRDDAIAAPTKLKPGETKIHLHPSRDEIVEILALYALTPIHERISLDKLAKELNETFPGLDVTDTLVKKFLANYIVPIVYVSPEWVKSGLVQAGHDLNLVERKLRAAKALEDKLKLDLEAMTPTEAATTVRALVEVLGKAEESLERYDIIPRKKNESVNTELKIDVNGVMDRLSAARRKVPIEVKP